MRNSRLFVQRSRSTGDQRSTTLRAILQVSEGAVALGDHFVEYVVPAAGWMGASLFLFAYVLISQGRLLSSSHLYQGLSIAGAIGLAISNASHSAFPSATLNLVWICIGIHTLMTRCRRESRPHGAKRRQAEIDRRNA
jgi:hypothetical protein